jgi:FkbM family methyltransferase
MNDLYDVKVGGMRIACRQGTMDEWIAREVVQTYPRMLKPKRGDVILDIGMNIGVFAVMAAKAGARVIGYEPDPENCELAASNIKQNGVWEQCVVRHGGVSDETGLESLYLNEKRNRGNHTIVPVRGRRWITVDMTGIEEVMKEWTPNKLKIDCEGAEYKILNAEVEWLGVSVIVFEWHRRLLKDESNEKYHETLDRLAQFEFETKSKRDAKGWYQMVRMTQPFVDWPVQE